MRISGNFGTIVLFAIAGGFGIAALSKAHSHSVNKPMPRILDVPASEVIGPVTDFAGTPSAKYTLVEFGDYQCPPCHAAEGKLRSLLEEKRGVVRLVFRNLPLKQIHPYAMRAAVDAEAARAIGRFWEVHDAFYNVNPTDFNMQAIDDLESSKGLHTPQFVKLRATRGISAVETDMHEATKLKVTRTPTFILCDADNHARCYSSLAEVSDVLNVIHE